MVRENTGSMTHRTVVETREIVGSTAAIVKGAADALYEIEEKVAVRNSFRYQVVHA